MCEQAIIKQLSPLISGSGGGQSFYATGGGTNTDGIGSVISEAEKIISQIQVDIFQVFQKQNY